MARHGLHHEQLRSNPYSEDFQRMEMSKPQRLVRRQVYQYFTILQWGGRAVWKARTFWPVRSRIRQLEAGVLRSNSFRAKNEPAVMAQVIPIIEGDLGLENGVYTTRENPFQQF